MKDNFAQNKLNDMCKRFFFSLIVTAAIITAPSSCNLLDGDLSGKSGQNDEVSDDGILSVRFLDDTRVLLTKSGGQVQIDTNSFILNIQSSTGKVLYNGPYSEAPVSLAVTPDTYEISVESESFSKPTFDKPQWGDRQVVKVVAGKTSTITLVCRQVNSGVRLNIAKQFLTSYPSSSLFLKSDEGKLLYSYSEKRTAYFLPGTVSLVMSTGSKDETLLSRNLCSGEILSLTVNVADNSGDTASGGGNNGGGDSGNGGGNNGGTSSTPKITIQVDTTRTYINETFVIGGSSQDGSDKGKDYESAYTIAQARTNVGKTDVWVGGYIIGGDLTNKGISFEAPFKANTNLALGPKSNTSLRSDCFSVQLQAGDVRDEINLMDNPSLLHRYVYLKGDIVSAYFGLVGMKNVTDYKLK